MVRFVLVETSHPGNIGAAARALKTMEQPDWVLVSPKHFPHPEADAMASGATDWLETVKVVPTLAQAVADCQWVIGTSTRPRGAYYWPALSAEQAARETLRLSVAGNRVAIVFGPERTGLSNEHLDHCQALVSIPANKNYSSLNVAQAVQVLAYEVYKQSLDHAGSEQPASSHERNLAPESQLRQLEEHVIRLSHQLGFTDQSGHLLTRFRRIIHRTHLDQAEVNIVRGILATVESAVRRME